MTKEEKMELEGAAEKLKCAYRAISACIKIDFSQPFLCEA